METTLLRLASQIALVAWCVAEILVLLASRGKRIPVTGVPLAIGGLACFAMWMFLSALTIRDIQIIPRGQIVWVFSMLEVGTATAAWAWLVVSIRRSFHFCSKRHRYA